MVPGYEERLRTPGRSCHGPIALRAVQEPWGGPVDGEVLRRLIREAGGGVTARDLAGRTGTATAVSGGAGRFNYPDGVERLDPAQLAWAGLPMRPTDPDPAA